MPAYSEDPDDVFDYAADWKEAAGGETAPSGGAVSRSDQTGTVVGYVPFNKFRSALGYFVGTSTCDDLSPYRLYRSPPAHHPLLPQMRCHAVGFQPRFLKVNPLGTRNDGGTETVGDFPNADTPWPDYLGNPVRTTNYDEMILTLSYRSFGRVRFLPDDAIVDYKDEWSRYVKWSIDPQTEVLSADGAAQLKFKEGEPGPPAGVDHLGIPFPVPVAELLAKAAFSATIFNLPHEYISADPDFLSPDRFTDRLGTTNSVNFLGSKPNTLLLTAVKFDEVLEPVAPDDPDYPVTGWTATCIWEYFSPKNKGVTDSEKFGHTLFPWRKDGRWYYAAREGGQDYAPETDHLGLLAHVFDPGVP